MKPKKYLIYLLFITIHTLGFGTCQSRQYGVESGTYSNGSLPIEASDNCQENNLLPTLAVYKPQTQINDSVKNENCDPPSSQSSNKLNLIKISSAMSTEPQIQKMQNSSKNRNLVECGSWRKLLIDHIKKNSPYLIQGTSDVTGYCPQFYNLNENERASFWASFMMEVARYESGFNLKSRYDEGRYDQVTGRSQVSEGLLQLSYSDANSYKFLSSCREIDWSKDKNKSSNDPTKTIFNPSINLRCGTDIMNHLAKKKGKVSISSGKYWEVLDPYSRYSKVSNIKSALRKLPECSQLQKAKTIISKR